MYALNAVGFAARFEGEANWKASILHEHGISAYPEYVISSVVTPAAMQISRDR